jgi:hypothetical protein
MRNLLASFSLPWGFWVCVGIFLGGILFNNKFRKEVDIFLANMMGLKEKKRGKN